MFFGQGNEDALGSNLAGLPFALYVLIDFSIPISVSVAGVFAGLWLIFLACFASAFLDKGGFVSSLRSTWKEGFRFGRTNYLILMPIIAGALIAAIININAVQESSGVPTGGLDFKDLFFAFFSLSYAPINEEIAYRISPLGTTVLFYAALRGRSAEGVSFWRVLLSSFISPDKAKLAMGLSSIQINGIRRGISKVEWGIVALTSTLFGLAHYLSGGGWEIGKVSTASLAGVVLALVYLAYGAYAAVLLHWFFNYYFLAYDLAAEVFGGPFVALTDAVSGLALSFGQLALFGILILGAVQVARKLGVLRWGFNRRIAQA